jgi:hypothetical protein
MTSRPVTNASDCEGCPQPRQFPPVPETLSEVPGRSLRPSGHGWVIFTGGPPEAPLAALAHVLPRDYGRATVHPDGSIEYTSKGPDDWEPPSPIDGYERDAANPMLFRPLWKSCRCRSFSVVVKENCQCLDVLARCGNPMAPEVDTLVEYKVCDRCEHRDKIKPRPKPQRKMIQSR